MSDSDSPAQILSADGDLADPADWFPDLPSTVTPPLVVAVTGPQASGKSTLSNALFSTSFPVAARGSVGDATTQGILLSSAPRTHADLTGNDVLTLVLDVEGADARARGREAKLFAARCAAFVTSLADVVVVNLWFHDACRLDSAAYALLRAVLLTGAQALVDGVQARTALVVAVRDAEEEEQDSTDKLAELIRNDVNDVWEDVALEAGLPVGTGGTALADLIDLHVFMFPHIRHESDEFDKRVDALRSALYSGEVAKEEHSKQIPLDSFSVYAHSMWQSISLTGGDNTVVAGGERLGERAGDEFYSGEDFAIVAAYRCDEVFSLELSEASGAIGELLDEVEEGKVIPELGLKCGDIVRNSLQQYDAQTSDFVEEPVCERKRRELEAILDTGLMSVYMKNIAIVAREVLASFKAAIENDIPADYELYNADAMFVRRAKEGLRLGCSWTYETERGDLRNMMTEIASQQRKLLDTQVNASQEQSKAMDFLRMQHAQMQAVRQQALGGAVGQWNLGAAYRPPDSNVNLSLAYQQGKTNLQVSMVPDESSTLLGPGGFTAGVGPGNLGMSFNVNF